MATNYKKGFLRIVLIFSLLGFIVGFIQAIPNFSYEWRIYKKQNVEFQDKYDDMLQALNHPINMDTIRSFKDTRSYLQKAFFQELGISDKQYIVEYVYGSAAYFYEIPIKILNEMGVTIDSSLTVIELQKTNMLSNLKPENKDRIADLYAKSKVKPNSPWKAIFYLFLPSLILFFGIWILYFVIKFIVSGFLSKT